MIYQFLSESGEIIERTYAAKDAPDLGRRIRHDGRWYTRIISTGITVNREKVHADGQYPYLTSQYSTNTPGAEVVRDPASGKKKLLIESRSHERNFMAQHGLKRG